jgi:nucleoid-associated protein YgaU
MQRMTCVGLVIVLGLVSVGCKSKQGASQSPSAVVYETGTPGAAGAADRPSVFDVPAAPQMLPTAPPPPPVAGYPPAPATLPPAPSPAVPPLEYVTPDSPVAAVPATPHGTRYQLQRGDTLWSIAVRHYGDGQRWVDIAKLNGISDPSKLAVGTIITLP